MGKIMLKAIERKDPIKKTVGYYADVIQYSRIGRDAIIDAAQRNSAVPRAYIEMTFDAMVTEIKNYVMNGHSITLNRLGTINAFLRGYGSSSREGVNANKIKRVRFSFRASSELRKTARNTKFEMAENKYITRERK